MLKMEIWIIGKEKAKKLIKIKIVKSLRSLPKW